VQIVFAGKAHPKDNPGKELIRQIVQFARQPEVRHQVVFIEDYDMHVTSLMVEGVDIWLNTPLRPREASGTSGMKAAMNGVQNLSILDGWWDEADYHQTGWPIGRGEVYNDHQYQDELESDSIYELLEEEIIPTFYDRGADELPRRWIQRMKQAIRLNVPQFSTWRMVREYAERAYFPISDYFERMRTQDYAPARTLTQWCQQLLEHWYHLQVVQVQVKDANGQILSLDDQAYAVKATEPLTVIAHLKLGILNPTDVIVQTYQGPVNEAGEIMGGTAAPMPYSGQAGELAVFTGQVHYTASGLQGLALRILPYHPDLHDPYELRLIHWA
jgi:starch phosphorylase